MDKADKDFLENAQKEQEDLNESMKEAFKQRDQRLQTETIRKLKAEVGNLEVQVSEYQQIIKELTEKLQAYDNKMGSVFVKSNNTNN